MDRPLILTVLRTGGEYRQHHVERLAAQYAKFGYDLVCLSDAGGPNTIPLEHNWPGWWAKMELFRPDIRGDFFYTDLDTTIVDDPAPLLDVNNTTVLRQNYRPLGLGSGVMFWKEQDRTQVWDAWQKRRDFCRGGDQRFIESVMGEGVDRWQDVRPGLTASYKVDVVPNGDVPEGVCLVYFHGKPRPWSKLDVAPFLA